MTKRNTLVAALAVLTVLIMAYLLLSSKEVDIAGNIRDSSTGVSAQNDERQYRNKVNALVVECESLLREMERSGGSGPDGRVLDDLKSRVIDLRAPREDYKDLHLRLLLAIRGLAAYSDSADDSVIRESSRHIAGIREAYPWVLKN